MICGAFCVCDTVQTDLRKEDPTPAVVTPRKQPAGLQTHQREQLNFKALPAVSTTPDV